MNFSNTTDVPLDLEECPEYSEFGDELLNTMSFYLEGIIQTPIAIVGILGNSLACLVLASKEMRNSFNLMLIALAVFDSGYLFGSILESFRKSFNLATWLHTLLFPQFLFPGVNFIHTIWAKYQQNIKNIAFEFDNQLC